MKVLIGVDVGGSTIAAGLVTEEGEVLATEASPTHAGGPGTALPTLARLVDDLLEGGEQRGLSPTAVGVGLPGIVDPARGGLVSSFNYVPELADVPLTERLGADTGLPVFVDNDVNALALGAWMFGPGRGTRSLALLAVGTGVGGGVILDGTLVRGAHGCAGEIGHITIERGGTACACGGRGCLCGFVGGRAIEKEARRRVAATRDSGLLALAGGDPGAITCRLVFEAAAREDALARAIVDEAVEALGAGLGAILNVLDPELIVLTGGVANSLLGLESEIRRHTARFALRRAFDGARIVVAPGGKHETVRGGAALARYEQARGLRAAGIP